MDALEAGIGREAILQLGGPVDPVAIRSADDGTLTCLVMPVKLLERATA
jgi:DNA polymerase III sliding clamp (beta) subunit (PCNA family)